MAESPDFTARQMPEQITVQSAKGRPMLTWVGKRAPAHFPVLPAQCVETFTPPSLPTATAALNAIYHGDNREVLAHLLANGWRGQVRLIYIDPPFDSGADYVRQVRLRGGEAERLNGAAPSLGEQVQYSDIWANDNYLQFMYERLPLLRELLAEDGTLWLHCDHRKVHHLRMLLEEVFGPDNYLNTIAWRSQVARGAKVNAFYFPYSTHSIEIFAKNRSAPPCWHPPKKRVIMTAAEAARHYLQDEGGFFRTSDPGSYSFARLCELHAAGRLYAPFGGTIVIDTANERVYGSNGGSIGIKYYLTPWRDEGGDDCYMAEQVIDNLWDDIPGLGTTPSEEVGYPTQKTEALLERIISASTNPGDLVLDCFMGSGTTLAVAQKLDRRWIGCDINWGSIQTVVQRLHGDINAKITKTSDHPAAHATFALYRINGYALGGADLPNGTLSAPLSQAALVGLASEAVGVQRTRNDVFFEGKLGERLVKFADFSRPLLVADLAAIGAELHSRPQEGRGVVVICLGSEVTTAEWVTNWNRHRQGVQQGIPSLGFNHLEVIELYSDPRYGGFFVHQPAQARITVSRHTTDRSKLQIQIRDFISPTIITRLQRTGGVVTPTISDWRAMVDSVAIDPDYDGQVLRVALADAPRKRNEMVHGKYEIAGPLTPTTVAVKITDMLGEELLVTQVVD